MENTNHTGSAPVYQVPTNVPLAAIEYPALLTSDDIPFALRTLGGIDSLTRALYQKSTNTTSTSPDLQQQQQPTPTNTASTSSSQQPLNPIELQLSPDNPYFRPIEGAVYSESRNILLRVKKNAKSKQVTSVEPLGVVGNIVRFRGMADFQYLPDPNDPAVQVSEAIRSLDVNAIQSSACDRLDDEEPPPPSLTNPEHSIPPFLPPPAFSRSTVPSIYEFKQNAPVEQVTKTSKSSGEEYTRLAYTSPYQTVTQIQIPFTKNEVPQAPTDEMLNSAAAKKIDPTLLQRVNELLIQRPVWSRQALINQLDDDLANHAINYKAIWGMTTYTFSDGPFRELNIRFGFDPRVDVSSRMYQRITLRNVANYRNKPVTGNYTSSTTTALPSLSTPTATTSSTAISGGSIKNRDRETHIFDGLTCRSLIATFQIIDITDPLIKSISNNQYGLRSECDISTGWFTAQVDHILRQALKRKHDALVKGVVVSDIDMQDLMMALPSTSSNNNNTT